MTSLIDIIFLLLLFFMLTSTFSRFAEVELAAAGSGGAVSGDIRPLFLRLGADGLSLNGDELALEDLAGRLAQSAGPETTTPVLVSLGDGVTAQRLTDLLVALRPVRGVAVTVLGS
ncbi:biopolymer transporter ExbD [Pukyongiella litopenaei]|nr:biopolymer transporter ExbD [Pukyongiella litopenaei]